MVHGRSDATLNPGGVRASALLRYMPVLIHDSMPRCPLSHERGRWQACRDRRLLLCHAGRRHILTKGSCRSSLALIAPVHLFTRLELTSFCTRLATHEARRSMAKLPHCQLFRLCRRHTPLAYAWLLPCQVGASQLAEASRKRFCMAAGSAYCLMPPLAA